MFIGIIPTYNTGFTYRIPIISLYLFTVHMGQDVGVKKSGKLVTSFMDGPLF